MAKKKIEDTNVDKKELTTRLDKIDSLRAELKKHEKSAAKDIMSLLKVTMKENPLIVGLRWQQGTPGFNDGEPCLFNVHGPFFKFADSVTGGEKVEAEDEDDEDQSRGWLDAEYELDEEWWSARTDILNHKEIAALKKTVKEVTKVYNQLTTMESELADMFDDGTEVTVTATGVECEDYSFD